MGAKGDGAIIEALLLNALVGYVVAGILLGAVRRGIKPSRVSFLALLHTQSDQSILSRFNCLLFITNNTSIPQIK